MRYNRRLFIDGAKYSELSKREVLDRILYTIGLRVQPHKGNEVINLGKVPFVVPKNAKFDALTDYIQKRINTLERQFPATYTRKNTFHSSH